MSKKQQTAKNDTCFTCIDNKILCGGLSASAPISGTYCPLSEICNGCKICNTQRHEPCVHCDFKCSHEITCHIRKGWIKAQSVDIKNSLDATKNKESIEVSENRYLSGTNCRECPYDYFCATNEDVCPDDMINMTQQQMINFLKFRKKSVEDMWADNQKNKVKEIDVTSKDKKQKKIAYTYQPHNDGVWESDITCISECPHKSTEIKIHLTTEVVMKILHLQKEFPNHEFTLYTNTIVEEDKHIIKDIVIPKQQVTFASVNDIVCDGNYNTIIHKHPGDKPGGFSGVDNEFANTNHDFSILIGSKNLDGILGVARIKTDCGKFMKASLKFEVMLPTVTDEKFLHEVNNISKKEYTSILSNEKDINDKWDAARRFYFY